MQGIVTSSIAYYVQGLVIKSRGPVFASAFSPLMMIIVAIMGSFILAENIYLGGYALPAMAPSMIERAHPCTGTSGTGSI